jgi:hypothetical protein
MSPPVSTLNAPNHKTYGSIYELQDAINSSSLLCTVEISSATQNPEASD